jgi:hypothetical protein
MSDSLEVLNTRETARYLGVSEVFVKKRRRLGKGPRFYRIGGRVIYKRTDLDAFLEAHAVEPRPVSEAS